MKLEPIVKTFYEGLEKGKLLGRRCLECGAIEFPPHPACNICGHRETEWVEVSGKAEMIDFILPGTMGARPNLEQVGTYAYGTIRLEEGTEFKGVIFGVSAENAQDIRASLPVSIHPRITPEKGYTALYFELD